jgi:hypothetical protein
MVTNIGESVVARLKAAVREKRIAGVRDMPQVATLWATECTMRRLQVAEMLDDIVLKGGRLWTAWGDCAARPTQDFDYSGQEHGLRDCDDEAAKDYIRRLMSALETDTADGLVVDRRTFTVDKTAAPHGGFTLQGQASLHTMRIPMIIEVGFGHALPEGATETIFWCPILKGFGEDIPLRAYTREMWLAEKIRIAVAYGQGNTRLKDYFDMCRLFDRPIDRELLAACFEATCLDHGTVLPENGIAGAAGFSPEFAAANARLWRDRRWPEWTGRPFDPAADPGLPEAVARLAALVEEHGLLPAAPAPAPR